MQNIVTESTATHVAVGVEYGSVLDLRVYVYWSVDRASARVVLKNDALTEEYGAWAVLMRHPLPDGAIPDSVLNKLVGDVFHRASSVDPCVTDPIPLAAFFSRKYGWDWVPEKLA
ncbi:hypothetical protein [Streptomyces sp. NPDC004682]